METLGELYPRKLPRWQFGIEAVKGPEADSCAATKSARFDRDKYAIGDRASSSRHVEGSCDARTKKPSYFFGWSSPAK